MALTIKLGHYQGPPNKITKDDLITWNSTDFECTFKAQEGVDNKNPVILLSLTSDTAIAPQLNNFNYASIEDFGYYFVDHINFLRYKLYELYLRRDILMTYKSQILNSAAYVTRSENDYNTYFEDSGINTYAYNTYDVLDIANISGDNYIAVVVGT